MLAEVNPNRAQRLQVQLLDILRRRLQDYLQLHMLEQPVGIFSVTSIRRTPRRLHIRDFVWLRTQHAQKRFRRHRSCARFDVIWLLEHASTFGPKRLQPQDELLKRRRIFRGVSQKSLLGSAQHSASRAGAGCSTIAYSYSAMGASSLINDCNGS